MYFLKKISSPWVKVLVSLLLVLLVMPSCSGKTEISQAEEGGLVELYVLAGVGMMDAVKEINALYQDTNENVTLVANFAASGTLQKQIEQGAPADVFISAGFTQMDTLQEQDLIFDDTRKNLLNNKVLLILPVDSDLEIDSFNDLTSDTVQKIAIGNPGFVPIGVYAQRVFDLLGISDDLNSKLVLTSDVRQVLAYVEAGNVDAGIVFATDAAISSRVKVVASAPAEVNDKVIFPVAIIKSCQNKDAADAFISYLFSEPAQAIFEKYGFSMAGN